MTQTFGDFIEPQERCGEHLKIGFYASSLPLEQRWRNNGLSADFLANYLSTLYLGEDPESIKRQTKLRDAVSYIANELLENALKFDHDPSHHAVSIEMCLAADVITLYATNSIDPADIGPFQKLIDRLLTEDPDTLYIEQLERNADPENYGVSRVGLLSMLNDYGIVLAWKFEPLGQDLGCMCVTTMARFEV